LKKEYHRVQIKGAFGEKHNEKRLEMSLRVGVNEKEDGVDGIGKGWKETKKRLEGAND